jgi:hypothetical protein
MQYNPSDFPNLTIVQNNQSAPYEALKALLGGGNLDIYNVKDLYKPFNIIADDANYTIRLIAKSPGTRLDVNINTTNSTQLDWLATATTITEYSYPQQDPFRITLLGNENSGSIANYHFRFRKKGYKDLNITSNAVAAELSQVNYLVTSLNNVLHNWDAPNNLPIAFSGSPMQGDFLSNKYFLPKSDAFYQGLLLLNESDVTNPSAMNLTNYGAAAFSTQNSPTEPVFIDSGRWLQNPLSVIPKSKDQISTSSVSQLTMLRIITLASTQPTENFYSFKYRNGTIGDYSTFYWLGNNNANLITNSGGGLKISGNTITPRRSPGLKYEIDLGGTFGGLTIHVGPVDTQYPGYNTFEVSSENFYSPYHPTNTSNNNIQYQSNGTAEVLLSAKTPGISFEIRDIVSNNANSEIVLMPILYNEINGVTPNPYNNKMGGFSLTAP